MIAMAGLSVREQAREDEEATADDEPIEEVALPHVRIGTGSSAQPPPAGPPTAFHRDAGERPGRVAPAGHPGPHGIGASAGGGHPRPRPRRGGHRVDRRSARAPSAWIPRRTPAPSCSARVRYRPPRSCIPHATGCCSTAAATSTAARRSTQRCRLGSTGCIGRWHQRRGAGAAPRAALADRFSAPAAGQPSVAAPKL
jgi:hypothetical protein